MSRLFNYFLRGLVVVVPLALTLYVCAVIFTTIDSWLGLRIRGVGFVLALLLITLVGFMASGLITRSLIARARSDCSSACRSFACSIRRRRTCSTRSSVRSAGSTSRCWCRCPPIGSVKILAFLTSDSLGTLGLVDQVTVYMPQSYGFAGHILVVPANRVERIDADAADVMAFIISGGVTQVERRSTPAGSGRPQSARL